MSIIEYFDSKEMKTYGFDPLSSVDRELWLRQLLLTDMLRQIIAKTILWWFMFRMNIWTEL